MLAHRRAIVEAWFAATLRTYPEVAARSLASGVDRFRDPAAWLLRENLGILFDAAIAGEDDEAAARAAGEIMRLRVVQGFDADGAVAFVQPLKNILRTIAGVSADDKVDRLAQLAAASHRRELARIATIAAREAERRAWKPAGRSRRH